MGAMKQLVAFVENIPDNKLKGLAPNAVPGTIHNDANFRLDLQGMTSNHDWNLQIQVNYGCKITSLRSVAPDTIAGPVIVNHKAPQTPAEIRALFKEKIMRKSGSMIPSQPYRGMPGHGNKLESRKK
ncbi:hypothetical protein DL546_006444 [Coniochaeta pulveracea]|uniref:Uncharacterized protein n=1 Tax=Coniochaeta pulveracea TaxID=177199 RepID=A0A420YA70_9PEZI|nr:hypothetical protein DL546_006444 [Coniochaeta pulveracea]